MRTDAIRIFFLSLFLSIQFCGYLFAYDEPDNFAGLKFGEDLTKQMEECPHDQFLTNRSPSGFLYYDYARIRALGKRCYGKSQVKGNLKLYTLYNMGEIQNQVIEISARQLDDKLVSIFLMIPSANASILLSIFNQRYGKPTDQSRQPWMSQGGVKTTSTLAIWTGKDVSIIFNERYGQIDRGLITYETEAWAADRRKHEAEEIKKKCSYI